MRISPAFASGIPTPAAAACRSCLLHANTGSSRVWDYQTPAFTARGYRVIAYDRRGFGRSIIDPGGVQPGTGADDLLGLVNHLGVDRFHLVGTAGGAFVALDFALSFPQRLRSLVIANSIGAVQDEDYLELGRRLRPAPQFNALPPEIRELGPSYRAANPEGTKRWVELEHISRPEGPLAPAQTMRNRVTFAPLEQISTPTLLLTGGADLFAPPPLLKLFSGPHQTLGVGGRAGSGALVLLGAAGGLQPRGPGVSPQTLSGIGRRARV